MKQTAAEFLESKMTDYLYNELNAIALDSQERMYSEEEVDVLVDMLQKCKEYFLLKTDSKSDERADAIGEVLKQFKNK